MPPFVRAAFAPLPKFLFILPAILAFLCGGSAVQAQTVTLKLVDASDNPITSIAENGGTATVKAEVSPASATAFTVEISIQAIVGIDDDFVSRATLSTNTTLSFAANATSSTGTVTITAVDNAGHTPVVELQTEFGVEVTAGAKVRVEGTVSGGTGVTGPDPVTLEITEDDGVGTASDMDRPTARDYDSTVDEEIIELVFSEALNEGTIPHDGVFVVKNGSRVTEVEVTGNKVRLTLAEPVAYGSSVQVRYTPPRDNNLDIDLGSAIQDLAGNPAYRDFRINLTNNTGPRVQLVLTPDSIRENGGTSTVTATIPEAQTAAFTVEVAVSPSEGVELSTNTTLSFAANATESTGTVTITAVDNGEEDGDREVTVSGTASDTDLSPFDAMLAIVDDKTSPAVSSHNNWPMPGAVVSKAWLARTGSLAAGHAVEALRQRLRDDQGGPHAAVAGQTVGQAGHPADSLSGPGGSSPDSSPLSGRELLAGSVFQLSSGSGREAGPAEDVRWTLWGRGAASRFDAREGALSLDGDVTTLTLGVDARWSRMLAGIAVSQSAGEGEFGMAGRDAGDLESSVTVLHPYLRVNASERVSAWTMLGYGQGGMTLSRNKAAADIETNTETWMAAVGAHGVLLPAEPERVFELALRAGAEVVRTSWDRATDLAAGKADTHGLQLALEGSRRFEVARDGVLTPSLELGLSQDGGDAETGRGVEAGAAVRYANAASGLTVDGRVRGLLAHNDNDYEEWGASAAVRLNPSSSGRGLSFALSPVWGVASGNADRLRSIARTGSPRADGGPGADARLDMTLGYGFAAVGGRGVQTPYVGLSTGTAGARNMRVGWRLGLGSSAVLSVEGTRRLAANDNGAGAEHGLQLRLSARW